jgi:hypothetical protein
MEGKLQSLKVAEYMEMPTYKEIFKVTKVRELAKVVKPVELSLEEMVDRIAGMEVRNRLGAHIKKLQVPVLNYLSNLVKTEATKNWYARKDKKIA